MNTDEFGGIAIEEDVDEFGGVAVAEENVTTPVTQKFQIGIAPPPGQPDLVLQPGGMIDPGDPKEGAFTQALFKEAPGAAMTYVGNVARGAIADASVGLSTLADTKREAVQKSVEYSGNLPAALKGEPLPIDRALGESALEEVREGGFPALATAGQVSQGLAAMAPLAAIGFAPATIQRLAALGFSIDMVMHAPELFRDYAEEINKPKEEQDPDKIAKLTSGIMQTFAFAPLAGKHGASVVPAGGLNPKFDARTGFSTPAQEAAVKLFEESAKAELPNELITISQQKSPEVLRLERASAPLTARAVEATQKGVDTLTGKGQDVGVKGPNENLTPDRTTVPLLETSGVGDMRSAVEPANSGAKSGGLSPVQKDVAAPEAPTPESATKGPEGSESTGRGRTVREILETAPFFTEKTSAQKALDVMDLGERIAFRKTDEYKRMLARDAEAQREAAKAFTKGIILTPRSGNGPKIELTGDRQFNSNDYYGRRLDNGKEVQLSVARANDEYWASKPAVDTLTEKGQGGEVTPKESPVTPTEIQGPATPEPLLKSPQAEILREKTALGPSSEASSKVGEQIVPAKISEVIKEFDPESGETNYKIVIPKEMFEKGYGRLGNFAAGTTPKTSGGDYIVTTGYARTPKQALERMLYKLAPERVPTSYATMAEVEAGRAAHESAAGPIREAIVEMFRPLIKEPLNAALKRDTPAIWIDDQLITESGKYEVDPKVKGGFRKVQDLSQAGFLKNLQQLENAKNEGQWWGANSAAKKVLAEDVAKREGERVAKEQKAQAEREAYQKKADTFNAYKAAIQAVELPRGKKISFEVPANEGKTIALSGTQHGDFIIDNRRKANPRDEEPFKVTHAPSKLLAGSFPTLEQAKDYIRAFIHSEAKTGLKEIPKDDLVKMAQIRLALTAGGDVPKYFEEAVIPKAPEGLIGMGGAIPAEFEPVRGKATGIKNAAVDAERAERGLPPIMSESRIGNPEMWDRVMARIDREPEWPRDLVSELATMKQIRNISAEETLALDHRYVELQNHYDKITRDIAATFDDAQRFPDRMEALESLRVNLDETGKQIEQLEEVARKVGTEWGRSGQMRQRLLRENYTLANMEIRARAAKGGKPLTDAERAQVAELQKKIEETQKRFDDYVAKTEEAKANQLTDEAIAELRKRAEAGYDPRIIEIAETIVTKLEKQADKARERLKEKFKQVGSAPDPTILYDLGVVGAAKIARTGLDFAKFSLEMVKEFGDAVKPLLADAWKRSNEHLENEGAKYGDKAPQVRQLLRKMDEPKRRENITEDLKQAAKEKKPLEMVGSFVQRLAESFIRGGIKGREPLIDAVWEVLKKDFDPAITRREAMDAISGYGKFKPLNKNQVKAELRDLRGQMQQVAKLEDIQSKKPLQKTGVERRTPSDEERRLIQQVNEAKRRYGVVVSDPAKQLKSALDAVKTRLQNQISDLEFQIKNRAKTVKTRTPSPTDAETVKLEARRDELKRQFDEIFPKQPMTDAQRVQLAMKATQKQIDELTTRIEKKDVSEKAKRKGVTAPELEALRARRDALKDQHEELVNTLDPERAERLELAALKARISENTAKYQERLANEDFTPKQRKEPPKLDKQALDLLAENEIAKTAWHRARQDWAYENLTKPGKIWANSKETLDLSRNILTSMDLSGLGRQGWLLSTAHPIMAGKNIGPMLNAFKSEKNAIAVEREIKLRDNYQLYERSGLYIAPHDALHLTKMEEAVASRWANKVPTVLGGGLLRGSNRAYVTFLNKLRADAFDTIKASVESRGVEMNAKEMEGLANYINITTGRGDMGRAAPMAEGLARILFSPRLVVSRFQYLMGQPFYKAGSWRMRKVIAKEYARTLAGIAPILALGLAAGATIELDPRSSDFLKLKFGNTRVDLFAGLIQPTVLMSRLGTGELKTGSGDIKESRRGAIGEFLQSKLAPWPGAILDANDLRLGRQPPPGHPQSWGAMGLNLATPITFGDIVDALKEQGVPAGIALALASILGAGVSTYRNDAGSKAVRDILGDIPLSPREKQEQYEKLIQGLQNFPTPTNSTILRMR